MIHAREYRTGDEIEINRLYRDVTGRTRSEADWRWQWSENPAGRSEMWLIEEVLDDGSARLIGHHGVMPYRARIDGEDCLVGKTENTMVHPDHRSRILYPRFERRFLAAYEERFAMLFSTTGPAAAIRLRKAMGYDYRDPMWHDLLCRGIAGGFGLARAWFVRRAMRGSTGFIATALPERSTRGVSVVPVDDARFIESWATLEREAPVISGELRFDRGPEVIDWRYARHPSKVYRAIRFENILAIAHLRFGHILCIDELLSDEADVERLWHSVSRMIRRLRLRVIDVVGIGDVHAHLAPLSRDGWRPLDRRTKDGEDTRPGMPYRIGEVGTALGIDIDRPGFSPLVFEGPGRGG